MPDKKNIIDESKIADFIMEIGQSKKHKITSPYKPCVLLYTLGRCWNLEPRLVRYKDATEAIRDLVRRFGHSSYKAEGSDGFWFLKNDKPALWELTATDDIAQKIGSVDNHSRPSHNQMKNSDLAGGFIHPLYIHFIINKYSLIKTIFLVLDRHFPKHKHLAILQAIGVPDYSLDDGEFSEGVITAYDRSCSICGHQVTLGGLPVGLEAAHIKPVSAGGPNELKNGIAFCSVHRQMFDSGCFTISAKPEIYTLELSGAVEATETIQVFRSLPDQTIKQPVDVDARPDPELLQWHRENVFVSSA